MKKKTKKLVAFLSVSVAGKIVTDSLPDIGIKRIAEYALRLWLIIAPFIVPVFYCAVGLCIVYGIRLAYIKTIEGIRSVIFMISIVTVAFKVFESVMKAKHLADTNRKCLE